jgi:phospholipid/cholesterol/gamma-HCH transport system substrate-binding protein
MTLARIAGATVLLVAVVVVGYLLLGTGGGTTYTLIFQSASQLVRDNDVQIGGRRVGSVQSIGLTDDNQAAIKISLDDDFAPLHEGTTATIRLTSLSGVANRYIALSPGPSNAKTLDAGTTLPAEDTTSTVDLDQIFNTLDPKTRKGLSNLIQGFGTQYAGKGPQANESLKYFAPALSSTSALASALTADQKTFEQFVANTAGLVTTLSERSNEVTDLIGNANTTAAAVAAENVSLSEALGVLPQTLRQGSTTFVNLRSTLDDLDKLVNASKPASKNLAPFLKDLQPLLRDANPTLSKLAKTFGQPGPSNDLQDALADSPALAQNVGTGAPNTIKALEKATPVLKFLRPYTPEFVGWLRDFGQTTSNYDANGHYARVQPVFDNYNLDGNNTLQPKSRSALLQDFTHGQVARCPGTASQAPVDGSAPFRDVNGTLDCDPSLQVPGP